MTPIAGTAGILSFEFRRLEMPLTAIRRFFDRHPRYQSALAVAVLVTLTESAYLRPGIVAGTSALVGSDYFELHVRRIAFARQAIFSAHPTLPAWYPHEFLGMPFAANLQSFPWIPTRLLLLLLDPSVAYAAGVAMAAALSAIFTYLYCRRAGLTRTGAVAAGWTFACAGYFASRVMAGHLPLLEAYPALPLLLWLADRAVAPEREARRRFDLSVLALSTTCIVSAGHPQVPAYALGSALAYALWRGANVRWALRARVAGAMLLGAGLAMAAWWPMLMLIGRSTRILHLAAPDNDIAMPYARVLALIGPGMQGWAEPAALSDQNPFDGYPNNAYFWDTASYVGILPLVAVVGLLILCIARKRMPEGRWRFLASVGSVAFLCSLPLASPLLHLAPGTLLRSPARLLYLSTFCAAIALGVSVDSIRNAAWLRRAPMGQFVLFTLLAAHFVDLWGFAQHFILLYPLPEDPADFQSVLDRDLAGARIATARDGLSFSYGTRYDDAGGFDSISLATYNRGILALCGLPPDLNEQMVDASQFPVRALEATGVRFVITPETRSDLELAGSTDEANLYRVASPAARAEFFAADRTEYVADDRIPEMFASDPHGKLLLPLSARLSAQSGIGLGNDSTAVGYSRPASDEIVVIVSGREPGFLRVLEAYDPGWTATVDGASVPVIRANGLMMAISVGPGSHSVRLRYKTPGSTAGVVLSFVSLGLLAVLIGSTAKGK